MSHTRWTFILFTIDFMFVRVHLSIV